MIRGPCRKRHISEGWINTGCRSHKRTVCNKHIGSVPYLVVLVQYRGFWILTHTGGAHFVNASSQRAVTIIALYIFCSGGSQHFHSVIFHIHPHFSFIVLV